MPISYRIHSKISEESFVCTDHVHLSVAIPPKLSISNFMGYLKGKSTLMIYDIPHYKVNGIRRFGLEDIM